MSSSLPDLTSDLDVQRQLERLRTRLVVAPERRERWAEAIAGALFVGAALALIVAAPPGIPDLLAALALTLAYATALLIEIEVGSEYTVPTVTVLVPMAFLLAPGWLPACVVAAHLAAYALNVARGRRSLKRIYVVFGQGWMALGFAAVFAAAPPGGASWDDLPVVLAALGAGVALDALSSLSVDRFGFGERLRALLVPAAWVYAVDLLLVPVGLMAAIAADGHPAGLIGLAPLGLMLAVFGHERRTRHDNALELSRAYRGTALLLGDVIESDDGYTGSHSRDVVELSVAVGVRMGVDAVQLRNLEFGALLHDIGKLAMPKSILHKPGPLDAGEWAVMQTHTVEGQRMLDAVGGALADVGVIVRASHEHFDGTGYPDGLAGSAIPLEARICAACDAYSAMTTDRPYRTALPFDAALAELRDNAGTQFDPAVVDALVAELAAGEERRADGARAVPAAERAAAA
ncbi:MAG: hypothetical protein QOD81_2486 [Solirubrobacteraceae bacterium]|nr:hypothetical protein [Solirubrobacteraceae bacterium]